MPDIVNVDLTRLERKVSNIEQITSELKATGDRINESVINVRNKVNQVDERLEQLVKEFQEMVEEQARNHLLQTAQTELVRVRQEINQRFGKYEKVRDTMIGVLKASDLAIVKSSTITNISEEIMLQSPDYWLAPCLVAVAAWIGNNRDLAKRAIAEAMRRDEERTALTMALICRRNNRSATCYEWLAIYFSHQSSANFSEASFTYLNAYVNGIFGPDERHMCDDYVERWIAEIQEKNTNLAQEQAQEWKQYCEKQKKDLGNKYPEMKRNIREFGSINQSLGRIETAEEIYNDFINISNSEVDNEKLKRDVDARLVDLVQCYDNSEISLREEERKWLLVKEHMISVQEAEEQIEREKRAREEHILNLVQTSSGIVRDRNKNLSEKKTAITFIGNYINDGYKQFAEETKTLFPNQVTVCVDDWMGSTRDGSNTQELMRDYERSVNEKRTVEINANSDKKVQLFMIGAVVAAVLALIMCFVAIPVGILLFIAAGALAFKGINDKKILAQNKTDINLKYDSILVNGKRQIAATMDEYVKAKKVAEIFKNEPVKKIIA